MIRPISTALLLLLSTPAISGVQVSAGTVIGAHVDNAPISVEVSASRSDWRIRLAHISGQDVHDDRGGEGRVSDFTLLSVDYLVAKDVGPFILEFSPGLSLRSRGHNVDYALPSTVNVSLTLGMSKGPFVLEWRHHSNANTRDTNIGQDWLQVGYRFR